MNLKQMLDQATSQAAPGMAAGAPRGDFQVVGQNASRHAQETLRGGL